jgi:glutaredoxin
MRDIVAILLVLFVFAVTPAHAAKLYKWVDKDGNVSYQDSPPPPNAGRVEQKDLATGLPEKKKDDVAEKYPVVLYSVPKCSSCDLARAYLQKRKVPFSEKNVENDRKSQEEMKEKTKGLSVPTILVGTKVMSGYMESLLEGELDQAGYPKEGETQ